MKVALVGNMNNIFFTMLRYFRDLNVDAELILFKNEQEHFRPLNDTWEIEKWKPFIKESKLVNGIEKSNLGFFKVNKSYVQALLGKYDIIIGNGLSPVYANMGGLKIDFYLPYGVGVEFLKVKHESLFRYFSSSLLKYLQKRGIQKSVKYCVTWEKDSMEPLQKLGKIVFPIGLPMVYNRSGRHEISASVKKILNKISSNDFKVISHNAHIWKNIPSHWTHGWIKNDWVIKAFSEFIKQSKAESPLLILAEYGPDVEESKRLINDLSINDYVLWLPKMSRKELMIIVKSVDVGIGKVGGNTQWGGVGWEFLSEGIPFMWNLQITKEEYEKVTGNPFPHLANVKSIDDILKYLLKYESSESLRSKIRKENIAWFNEYGGIGLAKKYIELFDKVK